jgi:hypothetical protein
VVYQSEQISFVTLGFIGGKPMSDGKTGFDVRGDQIIRSEETDNAQGPVKDLQEKSFQSAEIFSSDEGNTL